jgi:hypothetical protein
LANRIFHLREGKLELDPSLRPGFATAHPSALHREAAR